MGTKQLTDKNVGWLNNGGISVNEIVKLAKELEEYTRIVGSHNKHIQSTANRLVELTEQPQLNENQKLLLEDLKNIKESHEDKNMLGLIWVLGQRLVNKSDIKAFTNQEILDVMWALEQEEEE